MVHDELRGKHFDRVELVDHHHWKKSWFFDRSHCKYINIKNEIFFIEILGELELTSEETKSREVTRNDDHILFMGFDIGAITTGHVKSKKETLSRLATKYFRLVRILSSNFLENYFSCLVKMAYGKRLNVDHTNSW